MNQCLYYFFLLYLNCIQNYSKSIQIFTTRSVSEKICVWQSIGFVPEAELMKRFRYRWHLTWSTYERKIWIGKTKCMRVFVCLCVYLLLFVLTLSLSFCHLHSYSHTFSHMLRILSEKKKLKKKYIYKYTTTNKLTNEWTERRKRR